MSKKIKVETGIEPPDPRDLYPFATMEIGESFLQPDETRGAKLRGVIYQYGKRNGKKFTVKRRKDKDNETGYRVWRTA